MTALLAPQLIGDGPKRQHARLRKVLSRLARRVAEAALAAGREDLLLEVYLAGVAHATDACERPRTKAEGS